MMNFLYELCMDFIEKLIGKHGVHDGPLGWDGDHYVGYYLLQ